MGSAPPTTWQPVGEPAAAPEVSLMFILGFPLLPPKPITPCSARCSGIWPHNNPISVISSYKAESPGDVLKSCPFCLSIFTAPSLLHPALLPEQGARSRVHTSSVPLPNHPGATHPLVDPPSLIASLQTPFCTHRPCCTARSSALTPHQPSLS